MARALVWPKNLTSFVVGSVHTHVVQCGQMIACAYRKTNCKINGFAMTIVAAEKAAITNCVVQQQRVLHMLLEHIGK